MNMATGDRIELSSLDSKSKVLPLNYPAMINYFVDKNIISYMLKSVNCLMVDVEGIKPSLIVCRTIVLSLHQTSKKNGREGEF